MLSSNQRLHESLVFGIEQVESRISVFALVKARRDLVECVDAGGRCVDRGDELQIAAVGSTEHLAQRRQTVNTLLHGGKFGFGRAVAVFYLAVVLEKRDVVNGRLDAQDEAVLVALLSETGPMVCLMRVPAILVSKRLPISSR